MSEPPSSAALTGQTILIIDDTPQNLTVLGDLLRTCYRVRVANSGERGLRAAQTAPSPDLILLDVMMPGIDGHEVMRRLRADPATAAIPVIFITALDSSENEEMGLALGAVDYITKPIVPAIVLARIRTHLEIKQARDRLADENDWLEREVARRIAENQDLERRLRRSQKMEALGTLAGGIAHDLNNMLQPIIGLSDMTLRSVAPDSRNGERLRHVFAAATRARDLVARIRLFSRDDEAKTTLVSLAQLIEDTLYLIRSSVPHTIRLIESVDLGNEVVAIDIAQIQTVLLNLVSNAVDAIDIETGEIEIDVSRVWQDGHLSNPVLDIPGPGWYAHIRIRDTGRGIPITVLDRIFDPFFTTKPVGRGTGLGLSMVHGIIRQHNGGITVDTMPGVGTVFGLLIPIATGGPE